MKTFLEKFYEKNREEGGFDCIDFEYNGVDYQISDGHYISYQDKTGVSHDFHFSKDVELLLDAKVLHDGKSLREVWDGIGDEEIPSYWY